MSPDEQALLRAVAAAPADDLPRLVYADWLEEHGRAVRAEFVRLQCQIARLQEGPREVVDRHVPLFRRQQELLDRHRADLLPPGAEALTPFVRGFHRGFPEEVWLSADEFLTHGPAVAAMLPLPDTVKVSGVAEHYEVTEAFFARRDSGFGSITDIEFSSTYGDAAEVTHATDGETFRVLSEWPRLRSINLESCNYADEGIASFRFGEGYPALTELDLSGNDLTDAGVIDLLDSGLPQRLERLVLGGNPLSDVSAFELADRLGRDTRLRYLNLRFTNITSVGQQAILARFPGKVDLF